ncbi:M23 family metallopeptidase [Rhodobacteraceae bacterium RKSG542]|uniref:M23 family metallopeptidase n=1 Tax=Pseudovibrio flavus TaxID=2529854 RepID=UPI0012BD11A9|nr:M23 family metallopeptidase [Pseudovibrio flavus]MTI17273.1 M23 family metallopeptidase [Pseudovibrio flavus]
MRSADRSKSGNAHANRTTITFKRKGKERSISANPAVIALTGGFILVTSGLYFAATGYLLYRDQIASGSWEREELIKQSYESEIIALRTRVEQLNAKTQLAATSQSEELRALSLQQQRISQRHQQISEILKLVEESGISLASTNLLPTAKPSGDTVPVLAYAPNGDASAVGGEAFPIEAVGPALGLKGAQKKTENSGITDVPASVEANHNQLSVMEDQLARKTQENQRLLRLLTSAIEADIKIIEDHTSALAKSTKLPLMQNVGGVYIPLQSDNFEDHLFRARKALTRLERLKANSRRLPLGHPVANTVVTSDYGGRMDPFLNKPAFHTGIDFKAPRGTPVRAPADGIVRIASYRGGYGKTIEIEHVDGLTTRYAHLHSIFVSEGDKIYRDDLIGAIGSTGRSTGPHLHYETRLNGQAINPMPFIRTGRYLEPILN